MLPPTHTDCRLKRLRSSSHDRATDRAVVKKPREDDGHHHPDCWIPSERFWDTLPKIYLTRQALSELDRRHRRQAVNEQSGEKSDPPRRRSARLRQSAYKDKQTTSLLRLADQGERNLELQRFARLGGPDLTAIRGFLGPTMSDRTSRPSRRTTSSGLTASSKRSGPYDANYQMKLAQAGVHLTAEKDETGSIVMPANYDEIIERLNHPRESLSPSRFTEKEFQRFQEKTEQEILESETMQQSMATIEGSGGHILSRMGGPFNNLESFDSDITMAVPDSYDGAPPLSIDYRVLHRLDRHIVPNTDISRPAVPNFFLEGKSRKGRADVAKRQAAHAGAIGARGIISLQSYPSPALIYDSKAYSFTNTYHDGTLKIYTTHATAPLTPGGLPQYYITQLNTFAMTGNSKTFREGATYYRNARDLASEQRDSLIQQANQRAQQMPTSRHNDRSRRATAAATTTNTMSVRPSSRGEAQGSDERESSLDTDTSTDELALDKTFKRSRSTRLLDDDEDDTSRTSFTSTLSSKQAVQTGRVVRTSFSSSKEVRLKTGQGLSRPAKTNSSRK